MAKNRNNKPKEWGKFLHTLEAQEKNGNKLNGKERAILNRRKNKLTNK